MNPADLGRLPLRGVIALPSQPLGALQVVPLVRRHEVAALTLAALTVDGGAPARDLALVPHGVVTGFDASRRPRVAYGGHLTDGARMVTAPEAEDLPFDVNTQAVIEFYSQQL